MTDLPTIICSFAGGMWVGALLTVAALANARRTKRTRRPVI